MSRVSTVYDQMITVLNSLMSSAAGYYRIPNVENLEDNIELVLRKGYALQYRGAAAEQGEFHTFVNNHAFSVVLTREVMKLDTQVTAYDTAIKAMLDDAYTVQRDFMNADQIGADSSIRLITCDSIGPVKDVQSEKGRFKSISVDFNILISEDI